MKYCDTCPIPSICSERRKCRYVKETAERPLDAPTCSVCDGSGTRIIGTRDGDKFWNRCVPCQCQSDPLIPVRASQWAWLNQCAKDLNDMKDRYKNALADAIRRPMGIIPDSAEGLVNMDDLREAELRRPEESTLEQCCSNGWANKF